MSPTAGDWWHLLASAGQPARCPDDRLSALCAIATWTVSIAAGLEADLSAVHAAFNALEQRPGRGAANQLKYLKPQMYRRVKVDLVRIRARHPN